jgi:predicted permease
MSGFTTIIHSIAVLSLLMAVGFICVKTKYIGEDVQNAISKIVIKISLPVLVIMSLTKNGLDSNKITNSIMLIGVSFVSIAIMYFIGYMSGRFFKLDKNKAAAHECMSAFGNVVFLGYPLIQSLLGDDALFYAALYAMVNDFFVWTLGMYRITNGVKSEKGMIKNLKNMINPSTIAFFISFIMMIFSLKFTGTAEEVLNYIGSVTTPLSMLFIGMSLARINIKNLLGRIPLFVLVFIKMIIIPMLLILLFRYIEFERTPATVLILQVAMPTQTLLAILASEYGGDVEYASEGIFISSVTAIFTLPFIYYMTTVLWR